MVAIAVALIGTAGVLGAKFIEVGGKTPAKGDGASLAVTPPQPPAPVIDGAWHDQFGGDFMVTTAGGTLTLTGSAGAKKMTGSGTLSGSALTVRIANTADDGITRCAGTVASPRLIAADCTDADGSAYGWRLER